MPSETLDHGLGLLREGDVVQCATFDSGELGGLMFVVDPLHCCWLGVCDLRVLGTVLPSAVSKPSTPLELFAEDGSGEELDS